ncbi:MAG: hypothetical protein ACO1OT_06740 [Heyndrickxia sp.]
MIRESSLKYPLADYLTSLNIPISDIQLEFPHPALKKRQVDLVTTGTDNDEIKTAFEFKIPYSYTKYEAEQKRIFNDLMRLYLLNKYKASSCYFIIVGKQNDFIPFFRSIGENE